MATAIEQIRNHKDVNRLVEAYGRLKSSVANMKEKAAETAGEMFTTGEAVVTAVGFGYAQGRFADDDGKWEVFSMPPALAYGAIAKAAAFTGIFGKYDEHIHASATGALCLYGGLKGMEMGQAAKEAAGSPAGAGRRTGPWQRPA